MTVAKGIDNMLHLMTNPASGAKIVPEQPAPVGPYNGADRKTGGAYMLVNDATGRAVQIFGQQDQIDQLIKFINAIPGTTTFQPEATTHKTAAENWAWILQQLSLVGAAAVDAAALAIVVEKSIDAAFEDVDIPTPKISAADRKAIIDGTSAKVLTSLGSAISNG